MLTQLKSQGPSFVGLSKTLCLILTHHSIFLLMSYPPLTPAQKKKFFLNKFQPQKSSSALGTYTGHFVLDQAISQELTFLF